MRRDKAFPETNFTKSRLQACRAQDIERPKVWHGSAGAPRIWQAPPPTPELAQRASPIWAALKSTERRLVGAIEAMTLPGSRKLTASLEQVAKRAGISTNRTARLAQARRRLVALGIVYWPRGKKGKSPPCILIEDWRNIPEAEIEARLKAADTQVSELDPATCEMNPYLLAQGRREPKPQRAPAQRTLRSVEDRRADCARKTLDKQCGFVVRAVGSERNDKLYKAAFVIGLYLRRYGIDRAVAERHLFHATSLNGSAHTKRDRDKSKRTIVRGIDHGMEAANGKTFKPFRSPT